MRFLQKNDNSILNSPAFSYNNKGQRLYIKCTLLHEQHRFCAYSEKYICEMDEAHIEHFNPLLKNTSNDNYINLYATLPWMNSHKAKIITNFIPFLHPNAPDLLSRINYNVHTNIYECIDGNDVEAKNLIDFLGFNKQEVVVSREKHIARIKDTLHNLCGGDITMLLRQMRHKENLSFVTALEAHLGVSLQQYVLA